ncbi:metallophosphoesterase [Rhodocyclaceae bacterium]
MIYFLGDVHGSFAHVREHALADKPQAVVFLGDIEVQQAFEQEIAPLLSVGIDVRWIRGNHDTDTKRYWDNLAAAMHLNLDGQVAEVAGLRIAGFGGVFRGEIWYPERNATEAFEPEYESYDAYCRAQELKRPKRLRKEAIEATLRQFEHLPGASQTMIDEIRYGKELKHLSSIFWDVYERLLDQRADILVTHEAPSCHPNGFAAIDHLAQTMQVKAIFHGHHHDCHDYRAWDEKLGFKTYGVGLRGITDEVGRIIRAGESDTRQSDRSEPTFTASPCA